VEIFTLREAERAHAEIAPSLGNNCFVFRAPEPVLEHVTFDQFYERPTSYGIPVLFPFRTASGTENSASAESASKSIRRDTDSCAIRLGKFSIAELRKAKARGCAAFWMQTITPNKFSGSFLSVQASSDLQIA
jgi:hypothetical protein